MSEPRSRDPNRTRAEILAAAARLFARHGFTATSLQQVADEAGVARATPSYFFGSKEKLWKAVLEDQLRAAMRVVPDAVSRAGHDPRPERLVELLVDGLLDFHQQHPEFLRLIQWSELQGNTLIAELPENAALIQGAVQAVGLLPVHAGLDPRQVVMSVLGVCYAHITLGQTLGTALGVDVHDPRFLAERRAHLTRLISRALL